MSIVDQLVKNLPAMWDIWIQSLGWEDPLEKGKATHSLQYPGLENSMDYIVHGVTELDMTFNKDIVFLLYKDPVSGDTHQSFE